MLPVDFHIFASTRTNIKYTWQKPLYVMAGAAEPLHAVYMPLHAVYMRPYAYFNVSQICEAQGRHHMQQNKAIK